MSQKYPFLVSSADARVVYSVEELGHRWEDGRTEALHVGVSKLDVAAVEPHRAPRHEDGELTAALEGVREGQVGVESVRPVGRVHTQL